MSTTAGSTAGIQVNTNNGFTKGVRFEEKKIFTISFSCLIGRSSYCKERWCPRNRVESSQET